MKITQSKNKKVLTYDSHKKQNGWIMELYKEGDKTISYISSIIPGAFKGYHLHRIRTERYVCIKGEIKVILYINPGNICLSPRWLREEYTLYPQDTLSIPSGIAIGLENTGAEQAWLINYPDPAYDPTLKDEQMVYTQKELEEGVEK